MAPVEGKSANGLQDPSAPSSSAKSRHKVRPFRFHLHHAQRKSLAKSAVFLAALVLLLALWYLIATRPVGQ